MKILLLSRYDRLGASSRVRSYQYIPYLEADGLTVTTKPLFGTRYLEKFYAGGRKPMSEFVIAYLRRLWYLLNSRDYDLLWIEYELLPWLPSWGETLLTACGIPYVVDYDDAIFHRYDMHRSFLIRKFLGQKINQVMQRAALVVVGNDYLAQEASRAGARNIEYLPSVVDVNRYHVSFDTDRRFFNIGWIGSPTSEHYIYTISSVLQNICNDHRTRIVMVGAKNVKLENTSCALRPWSEETEVAEIRDFDVGIMPLVDGPWEQGKCGYKIIQYMACGKPAVASPVGINRQLIDHGENGFLVNTPAQWVTALELLRENDALRMKMGKNARTKVELEYNIHVTGPRLASLLRQAIERRSLYR
jgi:glycosyltransferase involved in cell wall biosynthesis